MTSHLLLATLVLLPEAALPRIRPSPQQSSLRVVTWNIHGCATGIDGVVEELRKIDADVICLQEAEVGTTHAEGADQAALIAERLGMQQYSAGSRFAEGEGEQRMAILSRSKLEQTGPLDAGTGRIYGVAAVTRWNGRPLRVASIHLTSTYRLDLRHAAETSRARFKEASDLAGRLKKWTEDVVVAGDLNAVPGSPEHVALSANLKRVPTTQPTFPGDRPRLSIDHVYLSDGLRAQRWTIRDSPASDHRPVVVELTPARRADSQPTATRPASQETGFSIH